MMVCVQCQTDHDPSAPCVWPDRCECGRRIASRRPGKPFAKRCGVSAACRRKSALEGAETRRHAMVCGECGSAFDPRHLDQVAYHETHELREATGIVGQRVDE